MSQLKEDGTGELHEEWQYRCDFDYAEFRCLLRTSAGANITASHVVEACEARLL
jgi:hypothetical protein